MEPFPLHIRSSILDGIEHRFLYSFRSRLAGKVECMNCFKLVWVSRLQAAQPTLQRIGYTDFTFTVVFFLLNEIDDVRPACCGFSWLRRILWSSNGFRHFFRAVISRTWAS